MAIAMSLLMVLICIYIMFNGIEIGYSIAKKEFENEKQNFDERIFYLVLDKEYLLRFIDEIKDENEKERFSKYVLERGFVDSTSKFIDYIKDEELKKFYIDRYNDATDELIRDYLNGNITGKKEQVRSK